MITKTFTTKSYAIFTRSGALIAGILVAITFALSNPSPSLGYDQPYFMAKLFLQGKFGADGPVDYLEFVPGDSGTFSIFSIGSILLMLPFALLEKLGAITEYPARFQIGTIGFLIGYFGWQIATMRNLNGKLRTVAVIALAFGNWAWCNIVMGSAPMLSLGYGMVGELGAIAVFLRRGSPLVAGAWMTLALAHRFELHILLPLVGYLFVHDSLQVYPKEYKRALDRLSGFLLIPLLHLALQATYNLARFGNVFEMGYERIPLVFEQPGFEGGLYSWRAIYPNLQAMIFQPWIKIEQFPYFAPYLWGGSIFISSPLLILLVIPHKARDLTSRIAPWACALILVALLFHGNAGALQYSYRYGISLLPWVYLMILDRVAKIGITWTGIGAFVSIGINCYAVWWFYWGR